MLESIQRGGYAERDKWMMETGLNLLPFFDEYTHSRFQWLGTFFCACQSMHPRLSRFHTALAELQIWKLFVVRFHAKEKEKKYLATIARFTHTDCE